MTRTASTLAIWTAAALGFGFSGGVALADRIENGVAVFATLDKVTARKSTLAVPLGESRKFGALKVTPRACYSRPATELPKTTSFVEVDEVDFNGKEKRIFNGWMFAESPGLNAVEHPVFDVWLTDCQKPKAVAARPSPPASEGQAAPADGAQPGDETQPEAPRRRVRR